MKFASLLTILSSVKLCIDSPLILMMVMSQSLETQDWFHRFARFSPTLLNNTAQCRKDLQTKGALFSTAISYFRFGNIFKLTGSDRTILADRVICTLAKKFDSPTIMEVGVSDGSSALGILRNAKLFQHVFLTDRYNRFFVRKKWLGRLFYDSGRNPMIFKFGILSFDVLTLAPGEKNALSPIETVNPIVKHDFGIHAIEPFNMFTDRKEDKLHILKCANLLNCSYFSDKDLLRAIDNLGKSLVDGGYLVISQNSLTPPETEAVFALQKKKQGFRLVHDQNGHKAVRLFTPTKTSVV